MTIAFNITTGETFSKDPWTNQARFLSFNDHTELKKEILKLNPVKIDIGAVYNAKPKEKKFITGFTPTERELVFDIDMTDYDEIRTCCSGANICNLCWNFMTLAIKVLHSALVGIILYLLKMTLDSKIYSGYTLEGEVLI